MFDQSFGVIPYRVREDQALEFLVVHHQKGHWAFPKGHPEENETELETALRELKEETGLSADIDHPNHTFLEKYVFTNQTGQEVSKTVTFFLGRVENNQALQLLEAEVQAAEWLPLDQAQAKITFPAGKQLCQDLKNYLDANPIARYK